MRSIIRTSAKLALSARSVNVMRPVAMNFSGLSQKSANLADLIPQEIAVEAADQEIDQDYLDVKKVVLENFALIDQVGMGEVKLTRKHGANEDITIKFDVQDEEEEDGQGGDYNEDEDQDIDHDADDEEADQTFGIRFEVECKKDDTRVVFDCIAGEKVIIKNVMYLPEGKTYDSVEVYGGPRFEDLEPAVQDGFYNYLSERKVDEDMAFFVLAHAREKEQSEYVHWLHNILNFATK